jgi:hypothetical protein
MRVDSIDCQSEKPVKNSKKANHLRLLQVIDFIGFFEDITALQQDKIGYLHCARTHLRKPAFSHF